MNQAQVESLLRVLLAAGGPIAGLLINAGIAPGNVNILLTALVSLVPLIVSAVWGFIGHTDAAQVTAASKVAGAQVTVDAIKASSAVVAVAQDGKVPDVVLKVAS